MLFRLFEPFQRDEKLRYLCQQYAGYLWHCFVG